ncbi:zinc finger protein 77-like isoform X5 [Galleria mellonella]|uniref:Zinc finger protein 77-like isoform X5 n=1 Tax=Galleria mellonella TaxID=7137 RepID=A0ABM3N0W5_GALME|nr:zinc finger protein 77-like isoform X5 [Galleria mellonella]
MATKTMEWRPGPTVCRCCLAEGCYKDISTEYFWMGKREVYAEMLSETFSVSIAYSTAGGPNSNSRLICEPCISRLRDASEFKRQVQECEKTFMQHLDPGSSSALGCDGNMVNIEPEDVKVEAVKVESRLSDDEFDDRVDFGDDDDDDLDDEPLTKFATKVPKKESVDILDLLDNSKAAEKRKSSTKIKATPAKKTKKEAPKPTSSKPKPEKKKKGQQQTPVRVRTIAEDRRYPVKIKVLHVEETGLPRDGTGPQGSLSCPVKISNIDDGDTKKDLLTKEASRRSAVILIKSTTLCPFRFNRFYMCIYCTRSFFNMSELETHTNTEHSSLEEKDIRKALNRTGKSQLIKMNVTNFGCKLCNSELNGFDQLKHHLLEEHEKKIDVNNDGTTLFRITDDKWQCVLCDNEFNKYSRLNNHVKEHYRRFFCEQCGTGFMTVERLKGHLKVHENGEYPCKECGKVYTSESRNRSHYKLIHMKKGRSVCNYCPEWFKDYYQKVKHMIEVHGDKMNNYKCSFCPQSFVLSSALRAHERQKHIRLNLYTCDICNFKTSYKSNLEIHMACHSGVRNFKCEVCGKSYLRKTTLHSHMSIHNNDKRFICKCCGRAFVQKCSLTSHMKTHHKDVQVIDIETKI